MSFRPWAHRRRLPREVSASWDPAQRIAEATDDWYRDLVEHSHDLLCVHDLEGTFLSINPVPARLLGYTVSEMMGKPMRDFIDPQFREEFDNYLREIARNRESHGLLSVLTKTGERRIWEYHNTLRTEGTKTPIVRGIAHDVTERVLAAKAVRESNEELRKAAKEREQALRELTLFRTLLDHANESIWVIDPQTLSLLDVNRNVCAELGYSREELLSMKVYDIVPEARAANPDVEKHLLRDGLAVLERNFQRKDGTVFPAEVHLRRVHIDRDYNVALWRDITERQRAQRALEESEARERARAKELETVLDAAPIAICISHDAKCQHLIGNRAACEQMRVAPGQNISKNPTANTSLDFRLFRDGQEVPASSLPMQYAASSETAVYGQPLTIVFKDGTELETLVNAVPLLDDDSRVRGVVGAFIDITTLKNTEKALRKSERLFRAVYERSPVGIALVESTSGRILQVNPKYCEITGRTEEELLRCSITDVTHPQDVASGDEHMRQLADGVVSNYEMEKRYVRPDGSIRWVRIQVVPMWEKGDGNRWQMGLVEDITERKQAEEALRQSEERFRVALKNSPLCVFNQDRDLRYTWMYNPQIGVSASEKISKTPGDIFSPAEAAEIMKTRQQVLETGIGTRQELKIAYGGKKIYLDVTIEPLFDAKGAVIGLTGASMDVTKFREASEALQEARRKLTEEKLYLEQEIDTELGFGEYIGKSKALQSVMEHVGKVARSDATVLLLGETGTGKELVARAIHKMSHRSDKSFIKLNCAAIPSGLMESELFGNEKGAFTGALGKKIGRLELADRGTLFLDEIGEIPLALQPKLLRVLQDQEFERLGGLKTLKVDFRLVAATNRDLEDSVREKEFRSDLYYRLNVFPIRIPPLRERRGDIPLLVEHFVQKFSRRMNKVITSIPKKTMDALTAWHWPGNVRELENFVERSVILTHGSVLVAPLSELMQTIPEPKPVDETLITAEREHIMRALRESNGQIGGLRGAAMRLGLKRTTLQSKMKHLGINPRA